VGRKGFHPARREVHHGRVPFTWKKVVPQYIRLTHHRRTFVGAKNNMHNMVLLMKEVGQGGGILETRSSQGCRILENTPAKVGGILEIRQLTGGTLGKTPAQVKVAGSWAIRQFKPAQRNPGEFAKLSQSGGIQERAP